MTNAGHHWTEKSTDDFLYRIAADFIRQIESAMESAEINQAELAKRLKVSEGRVSQVLNNPGNLTLRKIVEYVRALGRKVAIVEYDDNDPKNLTGPVNSEIFAKCWYGAGMPNDFFALESAAANQMTYIIGPARQQFFMQAKFSDNASNKGNAAPRIDRVADNAKIFRRAEDVEVGAHT
jgi:transcriptional regulator with XRE-family HTH domain